MQPVVDLLIRAHAAETMPLPQNEDKFCPLGIQARDVLSAEFAPVWLVEAFHFRPPFVL
jgi:hypothetical protein